MTSISIEDEQLLKATLDAVKGTNPSMLEPMKQVKFKSVNPTATPDVKAKLSKLAEQYQALSILKGKHLIDSCKAILGNPLEHPAARLNAAIHLYSNATLRQIEKATGIRRTVLKAIIDVKHYPNNDEVRKINDFFDKNFNHPFVLI